MTVRLVDCRPQNAYREGHLPGAVHLDREHDLTGEIGDASRGRHPLPSTEAFAAAASRAVSAMARSSSRTMQATAGRSGSGGCSTFGHDAAGTFDFRSYAGPLGERRTARFARRVRARERGDDTITAEEIRARLDDPGARRRRRALTGRWRGTGAA